MLAGSFVFTFFAFDGEISSKTAFFALRTKSSSLWRFRGVVGPISTLATSVLLTDFALEAFFVTALFAGFFCFVLLVLDSASVGGELICVTTGSCLLSSSVFRAADFFGGGSDLGGGGGALGGTVVVFFGAAGFLVAGFFAFGAGAESTESIETCESSLDDEAATGLILAAVAEAAVFSLVDALVDRVAVVVVVVVLVKAEAVAVANSPAGAVAFFLGGIFLACV